MTGSYPPPDSRAGSRGKSCLSLQRGIALNFTIKSIIAHDPWLRIKELHNRVVKSRNGVSEENHRVLRFQRNIERRSVSPFRYTDRLLFDVKIPYLSVTVEGTLRLQYARFRTLPIGSKQGID